MRFSLIEQTVHRRSSEGTNMALVERLILVALLSIVVTDAYPKALGGGHAHSFHHFTGPVEGHHEEVSWKDKHGHVHHDYKAHPKYKYSYGVDDKHTKDYHGQHEHRDGKEVEGEYHLHEPGGNIRVVKYHSDPHGGFFAEVHNHGGNDHSGGTYGGHKH
ncbi:adult-specific cuticular protein ACP-22-like [Hylaeus volcanicus]|uniref:adult-specific cuticular protein ACP-22-like n=1 Tax=Hylaeus volcanicus TaxID=313075 RepID=UPI0023B7D130|nr:adult-specific cuticular protein ACP-22-like [Hylaeus volcanicus]